jgi:hypothetical protein
LSDNYNENGYTIDDVNHLINYFKFEQGNHNELEFDEWETELIVDALEFYKEMNFNNG